MKLVEEEKSNGLGALRMLKYAVGIVLVGGGAAFSAGKLASKTEADRMEEHLKVDHPALEHRLDRVENTAEDARYESQCAHANSEAMLRYMGAPVPRVERKKTDHVHDAGE